jgi:hypothetical protein
MPAEDSDGGKPATTSGTRLVERTPAAEASPPNQVLMQRVIALTGVVEISDKPARQRIIVAPAEAAQHQPPIDLSATSLEWGGRQIEGQANAESAERPKPAPAIETNDYVDAQWATHSSIALELCDDSPLTQRLLSMNIEDAVTQQYNPNAVVTAGAAELELVTKVRGPEVRLPEVRGPEVRGPEPPPVASGSPRVLVVPAALAWTVAAAFSVCALALAYLLTAFLACGHPSLLDPVGLRCVDRADVAKAR